MGRQLDAERLHARDHRSGRLERLTRSGDGTRLDAEERHHAVTRELIRHAAGPRDRRADRLEVPVQDEDDVIGQLVLGHPGEAAQIGEEHGQLLLAALAHVGGEGFLGRDRRRQQRLDRNVAHRPRLTREPHVGCRADPCEHAALSLARRRQV